uniref:Uncharacterized protein n=1 Tax=Streptomyces auratus AGR0001 TaxID=1160718 RepID=J1ZQX0_9ACTN
MVTADRLDDRTHDRAGCWQVAIMALSKFQGATHIGRGPRMPAWMGERLFCAATLFARPPHER